MNSLSKSQIQFVKSLQSRKARDVRGLFVAEGPKVVAELLAEPRVQVQDVFATAQWADENSAAVARAGGAVAEVADQTLERISSLSGAHGVVAVFTKPTFKPTSPGGWETAFSLVIDGVQDPGNLGTIVRCADWFGVERIVCSLSCADAFNAKVIQSSMGSIARVQVIYERDLAAFLEQNKGAAPVYAATLDGNDLYNAEPAARGFLVIGNESRGISSDVLAMADRRITIPRIGGAESLNAAVATGIILSHLRR